MVNLLTNSRSYYSNKDICGRIHTLTWRRAHEKVQYPRGFQNNILNNSQIVERVYYGTEEYHNWNRLLFIFKNKINIKNIIIKYQCINNKL